MCENLSSDYITQYYSLKSILDLLKNNKINEFTSIINSNKIYDEYYDLSNKYEKYILNEEYKNASRMINEIEKLFHNPANKKLLCEHIDKLFNVKLIELMKNQKEYGRHIRYIKPEFKTRIVVSDPIAYQLKDDFDKMYLEINKSVDRDNILSYYLTQKDGSNVCIIKNQTVFRDSNLDINIEETKKEWKNLFDQIKKTCLGDKIKFIIIPLSILTEGEEIGHAGNIIVKHVDDIYEIERFEPHGGVETFYDQTILDNFIENLFKKNFKDKFIYLGTLGRCPIGPQSLTGDEYCACWSMYYTFLRINNPLLSREDIISSLTGGQQVEIVTRILNFIKWAYSYKKDVIDPLQAKYRKYNKLISSLFGIYIEEYPLTIFKKDVDTYLEKYYLKNINFSDVTYDTFYNKLTTLNNNYIYKNLYVPAILLNIKESKLLKELIGDIDVYIELNEILEKINIKFTVYIVHERDNKVDPRIIISRLQTLKTIPSHIVQQIIDPIFPNLSFLGINFVNKVILTIIKFILSDNYLELSNKYPFFNMETIQNLKELYYEITKPMCNKYTLDILLDQKFGEYLLEDTNTIHILVDTIIKFNKFIDNLTKINKTIQEYKLIDSEYSILSDKLCSELDKNIDESKTIIDISNRINILITNYKQMYSLLDIDLANNFRDNAYRSKYLQGEARTNVMNKLNVALSLVGTNKIDEVKKILSDIDSQFQEGGSINKTYYKKYMKYKIKYLGLLKKQLEKNIRYDSNIDYRGKYIKYKNKYLGIVGRA